MTTLDDGLAAAATQRTADREGNQGQGPTAMVPIIALRPADSPRTAGESSDHVRKLAELTTPLPPIVVHRPTMRVVDGMHRVRAAVLRGEEYVAPRSSKAVRSTRSCSPSG
ncbi:hypothetical protein AB0I10_20205 [Streptomyces sp. NPDC050636]|uniref:hypothetical protein n=1 Tax=Streptomyces sp. NPDC050636 TaxID=3154510 RepID=UPI0034347062